MFAKLRKCLWPYPSDNYASKEGKFLADAEKQLYKLAKRHDLKVSNLGFVTVECMGASGASWSFSTQ